MCACAYDPAVNIVSNGITVSWPSKIVMYVTLILHIVLNSAWQDKTLANLAI